MRNTTKPTLQFVILGLLSGCDLLTGIDPADPAAYEGEWSAIAAGGSHTCALTPAGGAYCWGFNNSGQLGMDEKEKEDSVSIPTRSIPDRTFLQISAGGGHRGGMTCGLTQERQPFCWGGLPGLWDVPDLAAIRSSSVFACGLTDAGDLHCWGQNVAYYAEPIRPRHLFPEYTFASVELNPSGYDHNYGITTEGEVVYWSLNGYVQDPSAGPTGRFADLPVAVGRNFTCGLDTDYEAHCTVEHVHTTGGRWFDSDLQPVPGGIRFAQIDAGYGDVCGLTPEGIAYCWTVRSRHKPSDVPGEITPPRLMSPEIRFQQLTAGWTHMCGLSTEGEIYCWGDNRVGQLGNGTFGGASDVLVRVEDPADPRDR